MEAGERQRRELQEALVGTIGPDPTDTLLGYLPPVGWADVATKRDLDALDARLGGRIDHLDGRLGGRIDHLDGRIDGLDHKLDMVAAGLEGQFHRDLHKQDLWLIGMAITIVLAVFAQHLLG